MKKRDKNGTAHLHNFSGFWYIYDSIYEMQLKKQIYNILTLKTLKNKYINHKLTG